MKTLSPKTILILGAGKIGQAIAWMLANEADYRPILADRDGDALARSGDDDRIVRRIVDASDAGAVARAAADCHAVINACPYFLTVPVAEGALAAGKPYLDLTEDVASTAAVHALAANAPCPFIPQCGLAPGFVSIAAGDLARRFDELDTLALRVGALPQFPTGALKYNLTWSTDGLINEYCQPCDAIVDGRAAKTQPLEGLETFALDGVTYEAFNTSGGLGSLTQSLAGKVRTLDYRSVRYPGHAALMKVLLGELRLAERRALMKSILEGALPTTDQDLVLIFVTAVGQRDGRLVQESLSRKVYAAPVHGQPTSAIKITTAAGVLGVLDLALTGALPERGLVRQEDIPLDRFLANRFAWPYREAPLATPAPQPSTVAVA